MRKECIILKYCIDITRLRCQAGHISAIKKYSPRIRCFKSCYNTQCCRLSAAGRTNDRHKMTARDIKTDIVQ